MTHEQSPQATIEGLIQSNKDIGRVLRNGEGDITMTQKLPNNLKRLMWVSPSTHRSNQRVPDVRINVHTSKKKDYWINPTETDTPFLILHPEKNASVSIQAHNIPLIEKQKEILSKTLAGLEIFDALLHIPPQAQSKYYPKAYDYLQVSHLIPTPTKIQEAQGKFNHMIGVLRLANVNL